MTTHTAPRTEIDHWLLYDGECPFCASYVKYLRLREAAGPILLADARNHPTLVAEARSQGLAIDRGMVLKLDGRYYFGADCIHALSLLSTPSGMLNRMNRVLFRSRRVSRIAYPMMRALRNVALYLLGRHRIAPSN